MFNLANFKEAARRLWLFIHLRNSVHFEHELLMSRYLSSAFSMQRRCFRSTDLYPRQWRPGRLARVLWLPLEVKKGIEAQMHLYQHVLVEIIVV